MAKYPVNRVFRDKKTDRLLGVVTSYDIYKDPNEYEIAMALRMKGGKQLYAMDVIFEEKFEKIFYP